MRTRVAVLGAACLLIWLTDPIGAYWRSGPRWPAGSIVMHLQQGSASSTLIDGNTSWNTVSEGALAAWNPFLSGVEFRVVRESTAGVALRNGVNNVVWRDDVYGEPFGDAIAVAYGVWSGSTYTETDVLFDRGLSWNSYRGDLRSASGGGTLYDLRRVALHEFGHVLGLDHPDEHGQSVTAIMNHRTSNIDSLQTDDTNGARAIYGSATPTPTNRSPSVTASCNPCSVGIGQASTLSASATDPDGDSLTYQWTAPQGSFSSATASSTVWTAPVQTGNVTATVTVQDGRGGSATGTVTLQVIFRDRLPAGARLLPGQSITSLNGRFRLLYQPDGNLVLYDDVARGAAWTANTIGASAGQAVLQTDGNFVVYDAQGQARFSTGTAGNPNGFLAVQGDGNIVIYNASGEPVWGRISAN